MQLGGKDLRVIALLLAVSVLGGWAAAEIEEGEGLFHGNDSAYDSPSTVEVKSLKFNFEQNVSGTGFYTAHKYAQMPDFLGAEGALFNGVEARNRAHGSGNIGTDSIIYAESSYLNKTWVNGAYDEDGEEIEDEEETTSRIEVKEDCKMIYRPSVMSIGSRYYNQHPIVFDSLLRKEDTMMNRNGLNSLYHLVDQAHELDRVLDAQSDAENTSMRVEEDLVDGRAHFGVLQLKGIPLDEVPEDEPEDESEEEPEEQPVLGQAMKAWKRPLIEIDEDYIGSFHIKKNMALHIAFEEEEKEDSWLYCCSGGFGDLNYADRDAFRSARSIFDCTCFQVPEAVS